MIVRQSTDIFADAKDFWVKRHSIDQFILVYRSVVEAVLHILRFSVASKRLRRPFQGEKEDSWIGSGNKGHPWCSQ
jgi:hypothetical protein